MANARSIAVIILGALAFALCYAQAPLFYSNQNQYFLHGLAEAGRGELASDWLANTSSPTPVFDAVVRITAKYGHESLFYVYYAALLGLYFWSLMGLFDHLTAGRATLGQRLAFAAMIFSVHAAVLRWASYRLFGTDYACYAQGWLAAQYLLGPVFQPSTFGVFLLLAIERLVRGHSFTAFTALAFAGIGHSTYLLPGGLLALIFTGMMLRQKAGVRTWLLPLWSLALVLPSLRHAYSNFGPSDPASFEEAQRILVEVRIPHHCDPFRWCDGIAWMQIALMLVGIAASRRTRLFPILVGLFGASLALTVAQILSKNPTLALLFPWRSSAVLIPLAVAVILARGIEYLSKLWNGPIAKWASAGWIVFLSAGGVAIMALHEGFAVNAAEEPLMQFVRTHLQPGDCYLIPVALPKPTQSKGSISSDFKPLPAQQADNRLIPLDFQRFRLCTGAPIFIDFKAIPYRDTDVLEWYRRVNWVQSLYAERNWNPTIDSVIAAGITHVVVAKNRELICERLLTVYEDENYTVYRVVGR